MSLLTSLSVNDNKRFSIWLISFQVHNEHRWNNLEGDASPHVFNVAATAYRRMRETETDQVIIVSGESGSGKTESTKYMVRHVVHMCQEGQMKLNDKIVKVSYCSTLSVQSVSFSIINFSNTFFL